MRVKWYLTPGIFICIIFYSANYTHLKLDVQCCAHYLEVRAIEEFDFSTLLITGATVVQCGCRDHAEHQLTRRAETVSVLLLPSMPSRMTCKIGRGLQMGIVARAWFWWHKHPVFVVVKSSVQINKWQCCGVFLKPQSRGLQKKKKESR